MQKERILKPEYIERLESALEQKGIRFNNMAEFDKYFRIEEPKKPAKYQPELEPLTDCEIWQFASKCVFGLEYIIIKTDYDETTPMIEGGIMFCDFILKEEKSKNTKSNAEIIKTELTSLLANRGAVSETRMREIQHFMNEESHPYFQKDLHKMKPKKGRGGCFG